MSRKRTNKHHIIPKSRGGKKTVIIPQNFHQAWHVVFGLLHGKEACLFIEKINEMMNNQERITSKEIAALRDNIKKGYYK